MMKVFEVKHLSFQYPKSKDLVIKDISFDIEEGKIVGLLGPSGAGKSTIQKILTKLLSDYQGEILYFGKNLKTYKKEFYEEIGVCFEIPVHFNKLTALENMKYFAQLYKKNINYVDLFEKVNLSSAMNQNVSEFSKGMKVRLNFIRSLLNDPKVIFLDEPTNGLDPTNARIIKDLIIDLKKQNKTIFITTHLMGDVEQLCDEVIFITKGNIVETSTPRELKIKYGKKEIKVEYREDSDHVIIKNFALDNLGENKEFLDLIKTKNIETIHSGETSLENIFIKVTGEEVL